MTEPALAASEVVARLGLLPHPEGGHYGQIFRDSPADGSRGASSAIYYLLAAGERSAWHRFDAVELWHWYAGAPLRLTVVPPDGERIEHRLGNDLAAGQRPVAMVPAHAWMTAASEGDWTLVGCTVAPAFLFAKWELAPEGWEP